jgi:hypothetical protein
MMHGLINIRFIGKLKSEQPVSYHHKLNRNFHTYHLDLLIYQKCLGWHSNCGVSISSDSCQLLLPVGVFVLLMWLTQPIAHFQGRVIMGSDKRCLSDTIKSIFHADCVNTNVRLPFMLLSVMFCLRFNFSFRDAKSVTILALNFLFMCYVVYC